LIAGTNPDGEIMVSNVAGGIIAKKNSFVLLARARWILVSWLESYTIMASKIRGAMQLFYRQSSS